MANLDELIQKLSEKSKALTYDSGRWDSTQLAKKTKELTELLPVILGEIVEAISAFPAPLIVKGTIDGNVFTPDVGQPSFDDAANAFLMGATVLLEFPAIGFEEAKCTSKIYSFFNSKGEGHSYLAGDYTVDDGVLGNYLFWQS